jgi:hypothetical protein
MTSLGTCRSDDNTRPRPWNSLWPNSQFWGTKNVTFHGNVLLSNIYSKTCFHKINVTGSESSGWDLFKFVLISAIRHDADAHDLKECSRRKPTRRSCHMGIFLIHLTEIVFCQYLFQNLLSENKRHTVLKALKWVRYIQIRTNICYVWHDAETHESKKRWRMSHPTSTHLTHCTNRASNSPMTVQVALLWGVALLETTD